MSSANTSGRTAADSDGVRDEWLARLNSLVDDVEGWARELGWFTRRIEKTMRDPEIGTYLAPALLLQKETTPVLLEPVARSAPGAEGVVDLYLMPNYDDVASLYYYGDEWRLHGPPRAAQVVATIQEAESRPLSRESLDDVLEEMRRDAA